MKDAGNVETRWQSIVIHLWPDLRVPWNGERTHVCTHGMDRRLNRTAKKWNRSVTLEVCNNAKRIVLYVSKHYIHSLLSSSHCYSHTKSVCVVIWNLDFELYFKSEDFGTKPRPLKGTLERPRVAKCVSCILMISAWSTVSGLVQLTKCCTRRKLLVHECFVSFFVSAFQAD